MMKRDQIIILYYAKNAANSVSATTVNMFKNRVQRIRQLKTSFYTDI